MGLVSAVGFVSDFHTSKGPQPGVAANGSNPSALEFETEGSCPAWAT